MELLPLNTSDTSGLLPPPAPRASMPRPPMASTGVSMTLGQFLSLIAVIIGATALIVGSVSLAEERRTDALVDSPNRGLPAAFQRLGALEQTDEWLINQTASILDDIDTIDAQLVELGECCDTNAALIAALQIVQANHTARLNALLTGITTTQLNAVTVVLSGRLTAANITVSDTLTTRKLVITEYALPDVSTVQARIIVQSCSDIGNTTGNRALSFHTDYYNKIAALMPPTSGSGARPAMLAMMGDNIYADQYEAKWLADWEAANPQIDVKAIGGYSQMLGYWTYSTNTSENVDGWTRHRDNTLYKYGLYNAVPSFVSMNASGRVTAFWDDHDYGPNDSGNTFKYRALSKLLMGNAFGDSWWVHKRNVATEGVFGSRVLTLGDGRTIELIVLDDQFYREPREVLEVEQRAWDNATTQFWGDEQLRWLEQTLRDSTATYRVIMNGSPIYYQGSSTDNTANNFYVKDQFFVTHLLHKYALERTFFVGGDYHMLGMIEDERFSDVPIVNIISSGVGQMSRGLYDDMFPERTYANHDQVVEGGFAVIDFQLTGRDPTVLVSFCRSIAGKGGVTVLNQYALPARELTFEHAMPYTVPSTPPAYITYFFLTLIDARVGAPSQPQRGD